MEMFPVYLLFVLLCKREMFWKKITHEGKRERGREVDRLGGWNPLRFLRVNFQSQRNIYPWISWNWERVKYSYVAQNLESHHGSIFILTYFQGIEQDLINNFIARCESKVSQSQWSSKVSRCKMILTIQHRCICS